MKQIILFLLPLSVFSQSIKGKVYDNLSTVKGIKVYNLSNKTKTYTDGVGEFTIAASVNDTLFFESLFHHPKRIALKQSDLEKTIIFELKKVVNELGEVVLTEEKEFNPLEYTENINAERKQDLKNNLHLYLNKAEYDKGVNFKTLFKEIKKLLKKKNKPKSIEFIEYKHLDSLFKKDEFFTLKLLHQDLDIPEQYANLFLDYIETKNLDKTLISEENKVILLDSMVNLSREFLKITKKFETSKDSLSIKN